MVKVTPVYPKKRLLGLTILSVIMILLGMVLRQEIANIRGGATAPGFADILWFVVLWNSVSGRVDLIKTCALVAIVFQILAGLILVYMSQNPSVAMMTDGSSGLEIMIAVAVPTAVWFLVYFRAKSVLERLPIDVQNSKQSQTQHSQKQEPPSQLQTKDNEQPQPEQVVPITPPVNIDNYPNAKMVIEYKSQAATHWQKIQEQPEKFRISFLEKLENDPTQDIMQLSNYINAAIEKSIRPFEDENTNNAYIEAGKMGVEAAAEFKRVQDLLGSTLTSDDMLAKIKDKYGTKVDNSDQLKNLKFSDSDQGVVELTDNAENNKTDGTLETPNLLIQLFHVMKNVLLILIIGCFIIFIIEKFLSIDLGY